MPIKLGRAKQLRIVEPSDHEAWVNSLRSQASRQNITTFGSVLLDKMARLPNCPLKDRQMPDVIWISDAPTECQACDCKITDTFVDGVIRGAGWANMCRPCHKALGIGLGMGRGQLYKKNDDGDFVKVAG